MSDAIIRLLQPSDSIPELTALIRRAYRSLADLGFNYTGTYQDDAKTRERIKGADCYVMIDDGVPIGTITLHRHASYRAEDDRWYGRPGVAICGQFAIEPRLQRQGLGRRLMQVVERRAMELGAAELALDTSEGANHLVRFYSRLGYRFIQFIHHEGKTYRSVVFSKRLQKSPLLVETSSKPLTLTIRQYRAADWEAVVQLHRVALEPLGVYMKDGGWNADLQQIEQVYLGSGGEFLVGSVEDRIVTMGAFRRSGPGRAEIKRMRAHPECQRQGFGQAILDALEQRARALGYRELHLDTTIQQIGAQAFYEKNGYVMERFGKRDPFDCIFYNKALRNS